jgi:hypothetical protein
MLAVKSVLPLLEQNPPKMAIRNAEENIFWCLEKRLKGTKSQGFRNRSQYLPGGST